MGQREQRYAAGAQPGFRHRVGTHPFARRLWYGGADCHLFAHRGQHSREWIYGRTGQSSSVGTPRLQRRLLVCPADEPDTLRPALCLRTAHGGLLPHARTHPLGALRLLGFRHLRTGDCALGTTLQNPAGARAEFGQSRSAGHLRLRGRHTGFAGLCLLGHCHPNPRLQRHQHPPLLGIGTLASHLGVGLSSGARNVPLLLAPTGHQHHLPPQQQFLFHRVRPPLHSHRGGRLQPSQQVELHGAFRRHGRGERCGAAAFCREPQ